MSISADLEAVDVQAALVVVRAQQFLYDEAALLDAHDYEAWLELFTYDAIYEIRSLGTVGRGAAVGKSPEPVPKVLTRETRKFLEIRVARLERGLAPCEMPASLTRRLVSNVRVAGEQQGSLMISSNFAVFQTRAYEDWIIGSRTDLLTSVNGSFQIKERCVTLEYETLPRTVTILL